MATNKGPSEEVQAIWQEFWDGLRTDFEGRTGAPKITHGGPTPKAYFGTSRAGFPIRASINRPKSIVSVWVALKDAPSDATFNRRDEIKQAVERKFGFPVTWAKGVHPDWRAIQGTHRLNFDDTTGWPAAYGWMFSMAAVLHEVV